MAFLLVIQGPDTGRKIHIAADGISLGRHPECDVVLDLPAVSRQHAQICRDRGIYYLSDLFSRNGTFVNNEAVRARWPLSDGDRVTVANRTFEFRHEPRSGGNVSDAAGLVIQDDFPSTSTEIISQVEVPGDRSGAAASDMWPQLATWIEVGRHLSGSLSIADLLPKLSSSLLRIFPSTARCFVVLRSEKGIKSAVRFRDPADEEPVRMMGHDIERMLSTSVGRLLDAQIVGEESGTGEDGGTIMSAPLVDSRDEIMGFVQVDTLGRGDRFTRKDLLVLAGVCTQAGLVIENTKLHDAERFRGALERDLALARRVQRDLLPTSAPEAAGHSFYHFYRSADAVGGDYFDYIELSGDRIAVVIADVAGKGVAAALVMAHLASEVRYHLASTPDLANAIRQLSVSLPPRLPDDRFVTLAVVILETQTNEISVVNAGHVSPLLRRGDGSVVRADGEPAFPLGIDPGYDYPVVHHQLQCGDSVLMITDGFPDAVNSRGDSYNLERMRDRFAEKVSSPDEAESALVADVLRFIGTRKQADDMCLVCFGPCAAALPKARTS